MRMVRLLRRGELVLPKALRDRLGWGAGDLLAPQVKGDKLILSRVVPGNPGNGSPGNGSPGKPGELGEPAYLPVSPESPEYQLLREMGDVPLHPDILSLRSGLPIGRVLATLLDLEIRGLARRTPVGYVLAPGVRARG